MRDLIAVVKLARGEVGYFDDITRTHLTLSNPYAKIYKGMNTKNIKMSVHSGRLELVSGSFEPETDSVKAKVEPKVEPKAEPKTKEPKVEPKIDNKEKEDKPTISKSNTKSKKETKKDVKKETKAKDKKEDK